MKCKHKHEETRNKEIGGWNVPDGCTTEYDIYCKDCGKYLGHWAYGSTDLEYFLNTANFIKKCKFYIKDKIENRIYKKYMKKYKNGNDDLPF